MRGKNIRQFIVLILTMLFISININVVQAAPEEKITLKATAGFDSVYKIGNTVPISIQVENNLRNINGELQIEVDTSQMEFQNNVTVYAQSISLPVNSSKSITLNVPITKYINKLKVNIVEGKSIVFEKEISISGGLNAESLLIGILSDHYDSVSYMNDIRIKNANNSVTNVKLTENNLSEDSNVWRNLDVLVVNDYDTSKLTEAQYKALKQWVNDGGILLLGTGPSYNKTLSLFKQDNFIQGEIGESSDITTKALYTAVEDNNSQAMKLSAVSMNINGSSEQIKEGNFTLVHKLQKGKGVVAVAAFDFGINPITSWTQKNLFSSRLIGGLMPEYLTTAYAMKGMPMGRDPYMITSALRNMADLPIPKGKSLGIIFVVYIILVAPINYFILKRFDKREWMWISVPALSIVFGIFMYIFGFSTRVTEPIANVFSTVAIDKNGISSSSIYAGIFTPSKQDIKVEVAEGMDIKPISLANYGYMGGPNNKSPKVIEAKVLMGQKNSIEFYGNSIFSSKAISIKNDDIKAGKIDCNINYSNGTFTGEVINNSGFDLDEAYVLTNDNFIKLGVLKNGDKKIINESGTTYNGYLHEFTNKIYVNPFNGPNPKTSLTDEETVEFRKNEQKRAAINLALQGDYMKVTEPKLLGFTSTSLTKDILVNGKVVKRYEKAILTAPAFLTFKKGNIVEYPFGYIKPKVSAIDMKGGYDEMGMMFYGNGTFEVSYEIDKSLNLEKIFTSFTYRNMSNANDVKQYVWNLETQKYEEIDLNKFAIEGDKVSKYVSKESVMKIKIEILNMNGNAEVPRISVKGSVK
jgi:hypothetical protein